MVQKIAPREAQELVTKGDIDVVDVREPHEWVTGHVPGARLVPLGKLRADVAGAALGKRVLLLCERGGRSHQAAVLAEENGASEVFDLEGGMSAWRQAGLPLDMPPKSSEAPKAEGEEPEIDGVVGENVRRLRADRGWDLDTLAGMSGVGRHTLGQLENGRVMPSVGTLWKIARAFEVPFAALLAQRSSLQTRIFRRTSAQPITDADGRFSSRALFSPDDKGGFEMYELFLAARSREEAEAHAPGTRENLVVTQGRLVLEVGGESYELAKGDAIAFTADVPHAYVNRSNEECWMTLVMTYPR